MSSFLWFLLGFILSPFVLFFGFCGFVLIERAIWRLHGIPFDTINKIFRTRRK